jgi:signal transduction histidine kinase
LPVDNLENEEEKLLRAVALKNADSIFLARQRAEQELIRVREALEAKTAELARSLATTQAMLDERDRARAEADAARRAAQDANDAKGRFVNMVSHELRTPLGAIGGYAALLEEGIHGDLNDDQRKYVARIRHNQLHLLRLVNELLDLAKIESGQFPLNIATVSVQRIVDSVSKMIEPQVASCDMKLEVAYSEDGLSVRADKDRVEQILLNLLANAVKFTPREGTIAISTSASEKEVLLHVRDTGRGIPRDKLEVVFEPFVQIHTPGPGVSKGTGLGLPISRELARAMGGDLSVESESGKGSTFTLCLPRV